VDILSIEILNPKAERLLQDMVDRDLISIRDSNTVRMDEINQEVKLVRELRYNKMQAMKEASVDPLFLADIQEIKDDFDSVDHEGL
jgi:hypothetical protein